MLAKPSRRGFLFGAAATLIAAPAIVRAASLMPVKAPPVEWSTFRFYSGYEILHLEPVGPIIDAIAGLPPGIGLMRRLTRAQIEALYPSTRRRTEALDYWT